MQSFRSQLIARRTYSRPKPDGSFETWAEIIERVISHQRWLWERAQNAPLGTKQVEELEELRVLLLARKVSVAGRTLWLGGTEVVREREITQFNCSFLRIQTIHDVVDAYWALMNGCGVGFEPIVGTLSGFTQPVKLEVIRSKNLLTKGRENNIETFDKGVWKISLGDSAEAWVKFVGKILANKRPAKKLIVDFSEIRAPGVRLARYGWLSSGDETIAVAIPKIVELMNNASGRLLSRLEMLDLLNWLGTTLSSRRSAEISLVPYGDREAEDFITAKTPGYWENNPQRAQSNNSVVFWHKPTKHELKGLFQTIVENGGGEPGFINGQEAQRRASYFAGVNPCAEILLGDKSFCNLVEINVASFNGDAKGLLRAVHLISRANYRQTCVDLRDGILQTTWHELNNFLRLTGVGITGLAMWEHNKNPVQTYSIRVAAKDGVNSMADELGLPRSQNVTTIKPSGTLSKVMDTTEGVHKPLGKYIFNNVVFSKHDPLVDMLRKANYEVIDHPTDESSTLVKLPVSYEGCDFELVDGTEVNLESAISQLNRYLQMMEIYVDHNCSITVSYDKTEVNDIVKWLHANWDKFVGVSWLFRNDPTKTAKDLGFSYLPQMVVTKAEFDKYVKQLLPLDIDAQQGAETLNIDDECATGQCPVR